jgi:hypothetical protein
MALSKLDSTALGTLSGNLSFDSGQGIDFSATADTAATGASMASELLDDYEEGTWSPSDESGASQTFTYAGQPYYTKIGNIVTVQAFISVPTNSSGNAVQIGSLPFNIATNSYGSGTCFNNANTVHHLVYVEPTVGAFFVRDDNNVSLTMSQASGKFLCITATYRAS